MNNNDIKQEAQASDDDDSMPEEVNYEHDIFPPTFPDHRVYERPVPSFNEYLQVPGLTIVTDITKCIQEEDNGLPLVNFTACKVFLLSVSFCAHGIRPTESSAIFLYGAERCAQLVLEDYQEAIDLHHRNKRIIGDFCTRQLLLVVLATYYPYGGEPVYMWIHRVFRFFIFNKQSEINRVIELAQLINGYFNSHGLHAFGTCLRTNKRAHKRDLVLLQG